MWTQIERWFEAIILHFQYQKGYVYTNKKSLFVLDEKFVAGDCCKSLKSTILFIHKVDVIIIYAPTQKKNQ